MCNKNIVSKTSVKNNSVRKVCLKGLRKVSENIFCQKEIYENLGQKSMSVKKISDKTKIGQKNVLKKSV